MRSKDPTKDQRPAPFAGLPPEPHALPARATSRFMEVKDLAGVLSTQCVQGVDGQLAALHIVRSALVEGATARGLFREERRDDTLALRTVEGLQRHTAFHLSEAVKGDPAAAEAHRAEGARTALSAGIRPRQLRSALADGAPHGSVFLRAEHADAAVDVLKLVSNLRSPSKDGVLEGVDVVRNLHRKLVDAIKAKDQTGARGWATVAATLETALVRAACAYTAPLGSNHYVSLNDPSIIADASARYDEARSATVKSYGQSYAPATDLKRRVRSSERPRLGIATSPRGDPEIGDLSEWSMPSRPSSALDAGIPRNELAASLIGDMASALGLDPDGLAAEINVPSRPHRQSERSKTAHDIRLEDLGRILGTLPPKEKAVVELRFFQDLTLEEVSHRLGMPPQWISATEERALTRLRRMVTPSKLDEQ